MNLTILYMMNLHNSFGSSNYCREIAMGLSKNNKVSVICNNNTLQTKRIKILDVKGPKFNSFQDWVTYPKKFKAVVEKYYYLLKKTKTDIIHVHHISHLVPIAKKFKESNNIPIFCTCHGSEINEDIKREYFKEYLKNIKEYDKLIAVSNYVKKKLISLKIKKNKIETIYPGIFFPKKLPKKKSTKKINILFVGRITKDKGILFLIDVFKRVSKKNKRVFLNIVGSGDLLQQIKKETKNIKNIKIHGYIPRKKLNFLYNSCDFVTIPSLWEEPFGITALEAISYSKPVICFKKGGLPEIIDKNVGFCIKKKEEFEEAMLKLISNKNLIKRLSKNCRKKAEQFLWETSIKKYKNLFNEFL